MAVETLLDPGKIITKFADIEGVVNAVLTRLGDEAKTSRTIDRHILPDDNFMKAVYAFYKEFSNQEINIDEIGLTRAFRFNPPFPKNHSLLFMRQLPADNSFIVYMHEFGHIVTTDFFSRKLPLKVKVVMAEMLAFCFQYWACEEFDAISDRFKFYPLYSFSETIAGFQELRKDEPHKVACNALSELFLAKKTRTFGNLYKMLKNELYSIEKINIIGV